MHGAKSLIFDGCPVDYSMMDERLAYNMLNAVNISAALSAHAKVFLNGQYMGVYSFVQAVDAIFTREHWANDKTKGKGGLYKELWFNPVHFANFTGRKDGDNDDTFIRSIMAAVLSTPLTGPAAENFANTYFDTDAFVDITALDTIIGDSDDWRQRHNFYWYVKQNQDGSRKAVMIPWDYDRLYDPGALTRGSLAGRAWWDIQDVATDSACNTPISSPAELAAGLGSPGVVAQWTDIYAHLPVDFQLPITCDKVTKLFALGLVQRVKARILQFMNTVTVPEIQSCFDVWSAQIEKAVNLDPAGPSYTQMRSEQQKLMSTLQQARNIAEEQVNGNPLYT